jgi:acyl-CoA synthetase (NDP forming)
MSGFWNEIVSRAANEKRTFLMENECKELLIKEGITTTGTEVARSATEAVELSNKMGYPVVLKVLSPEVIHKSDLGGVKLNLQNAAEVESAFTEIMKAFQGKKIIGVTVQKMVAPGLEAIIGVSKDETFGPVLMFGLGGVFVEVLKDVSFRILPVTEQDIEEMITEIKGYNLLRGYRGTAVDISALKKLLFKVSALIMKYPEIKELDLNPVFLYPEGNVAIDARIILEEPGIEATAITSLKDNVSLRNLFYPKSIAVLGASDKQGKLGWNVFHNLLCNGFAGKLYPINMKAKTIQGVPAYASVEDIEDPVDLAVIIVPVAQTLQAFEECCHKGIKIIVIESAGFAETGESGKNIEKELKRLAESYNCRFVGPNCSGIINTHHNMVQSIGAVEDLNKGNIGMIVQAGVYAAGMLWGMRHIMDFGIVATIGNKADVNETDMLENIGNDEHVKVVSMYLEDVKGGRKFIDVAREVTAKKPVIILKSGRTEAGKKAVSSHTASLAGNDLIYDAVFKQAGIIRAKDNDHMFGLARAFSKQPLPKGDGALIISYTGSLGVAAVDALSMKKMRPAELDDETRRYLREILPPYVGCNNPVDYTFDMNAEQVRKTVEIGLRSEDISSFIIILQAEILDTYAEEFKKMGLQEKPILFSVPCREFVINDVIALEQAGFPVYSTPEEAVEALSVMYNFSMKNSLNKK